MNPLLRLLQPYPFERLRTLHADTAPNRTKSAINVSIGEPRHPTPALILDALAQGATTGLANYPTTVGSVALLDAVENAVSIGARMARKNASGFQPPSHQTASP